MLQDVVHPPEQLHIEDIPSPFSAQMFDFSEHDLFPETIQNSEVSSCSNCCYEDISYTSIPSDVGSFNSGSINNNNNCNNSINSNNHHQLSTIFDSQDENENDNDCSMSAVSKNYYSPQPPTFSSNTIPPPLIKNQEDHFDISSLQSQIQIHDIVNGLSLCSTDQVMQLSAGTASMRPIYEDENCLPPLPPYMSLDPSSPSCSFIDPTVAPPYFPSNLNGGFPTDMGIFAGGIIMGSHELQPQDMEFQGDNGGVYAAESVQFNSSEIQALDSQQLVSGGGGNSTPVKTEISTMEESSYKVGRITEEERKEKIQRYVMKRNVRNFEKRIKYKCRKVLADSRPRVKGRFAKNDDFGDAAKSNCNNHEEEDEIPKHAVKEEHEMIDTTNYFARLNGVNSFKCNYPITSAWINRSNFHN
ncbi:hypothetical protein Syun_030168 [Stephania yunnanensis]|uniref:CCT domain-containing protein n=1 Tax=Stephania yunnanensis TaxID=152371 RepID=A0AAP0EFB7_9MAGN